MAEQIFAVAALGASVGQVSESIERDITETKGNFLGAGDPHALPLFQDLNEMAGFDQRCVRSGVEPRKTAAKHFDDTDRRAPYRPGLRR